MDCFAAFIVGGAAVERPTFWRDLGRLCAVLAGAIGAYGLIRAALFASAWSAKPTLLNNPLLRESLGVRVWTGFGLLVELLRVVFVPVRLSPDYSFAQILPNRSPLEPQPITGLATAIVLGVLAYKVVRRQPMWSLGAVMLLVGWLALSNILVPLPIVFAERLVYGISAAAALMIAASVEILYQTKARTATGVAAVLLLCGGAVRSAVRDRDWHDELRLFQRASMDAPRCARVWNNYDASLMNAGRPAEALEALGRATTIASGWGSPHTLSGIALSTLGRYREAEVELRRGWALEPADSQALYNLAVFLVQNGRAGEASVLVHTYLSTNPRADNVRQLKDVIRRLR